MLFEVTEISNKELKFGQWFLLNKKNLKNIGIGLFVVFDVLLFSYVLFGVYRTVNYLFFEYDVLIGQMQSIRPDFTKVSVKPAQNLQIIDNLVIAGKEKKYDFLAKVRNPNSDWQVSSVTYRFNSGNTQTEYKQAFFLPEEEKYLMELGFLSETAITRAEIEFLDVSYSRVRNYALLKSERLNFVISDEKFITAKDTNLSDKISVSQINFNITNATYKNFWDVPLEILLKRGTKIVGVNYISIYDLTSFEKRNISIDWFEDTSGISKVEIIPDVNILDDSIFKVIKMPAGELK